MHPSLSEFIQLISTTASTSALKRTRYEEVYTEIRGCFSASDAGARDTFRDIQGELVVRNVAYGDPILPYYNVAAVLHDSLRERGTSMGDRSDWARAVRIIMENSQTLTLLSLDEDHARTMNPGAVASGATVRKLSALGYEVNVISDGSLELSATSLEELKIDLDHGAKKLGGRTLMNSVVQNITPTYNQTTRRFQLVRNVSTTLSVPEPQIPWAYLYQLAVKHFHEPGTISGETDFLKLVDLAKLAVAVLGVQPYSGIQALFLKPDSIMGFLRDSVVYDSLFTLTQVPYSHAEILYTGLIARTRLAKLTLQGMPIKAIVEIGNDFLRRCKFDRPMVFAARDMARQLNKSLANVTAILDNVFTHPIGSANSLLSFPPKSTQIDSGFRPLLKSGVEYWCPPQPIAGAAVLEAILSAVRLADKKADADLGILVEELLRDQFSRKGIAHKYGDYNFGKVNGQELKGECDIVIETGSTIVLFELKKKPLTRAARSGDDVEILVDISKSLLDSQLQAMGHEQLLHTYPELKLVDSAGISSDLALEGREVIRVSTVFLDYGSIQDRSTFQQWMRIGCAVEFTAIDPALQPKLDKLKPKFLELKKVSTELNEFDKRFPFENSYFLSLPQLLLLLDHSDDTDSFVKELLRTRRVTTSVKDFYAEYSYVRDVLGSRT